LHELNVRKAVLPGDTSKTLTASKSGGVGSSALKGWNVGGDHALNTTIIEKKTSGGSG